MSDPKLINIRSLEVNGKVTAKVDSKSLIGTRINGHVSFFVERLALPGKAAEVVCTSADLLPGVEHLPVHRDSVVTALRVDGNFAWDFVPHEQLRERVRRLEIVRVEAVYKGKQTPITDENYRWTPATASLDVTPEDLALDSFVDSKEEPGEMVVADEVSVPDIWSDVPALSQVVEDVPEPVVDEAEVPNIWDIAAAEEERKKLERMVGEPVGQKVAESRTRRLAAASGPAFVAIRELADKTVFAVGDGLFPALAGLAKKPKFTYGLIGAVGLSALFGLGVPSVDATVYVHDHNASLTGHRTISPASAGFDVKVVHVHANPSKQFTTTSTQLTPGAKGTVDISLTNNCTSVGGATLGFDQRVETASGVEYVQNSPTAVTIDPDGQSHSVPFVAVNPGPDVKANTLNVVELPAGSPFQGCLTATNPSASNGGAAPVLKRYLSQSQLTSAQGELATKAATENAQQLEADKAKYPGETLFTQPGAPTFVQDHNVGEFTDQVNVAATEDGYGIFYNEDKLKQAMIDDFIAKELGPNWTVVGGAPKVVYAVQKTDANGDITFDFTVSAPVKFNRDASSINNELRGADARNAQDRLKKELGADKVVINGRWIPFLSRLPILWINTTVKESKSVQ